MNTATIHHDPPPPAPAGQTDPPSHGILFKLNPPFLWALSAGADFLANLLQNHFTAAMRDSGILCAESAGEKNGFTPKEIAHLVFKKDTCIAYFEVNDLSAGLDTVRDALDRLHALAWAEIGYFDFDARAWQCWHPRCSKEPFSKTLDLMHQWADEARQRQKQRPPQPTQSPPPPTAPTK
jgi:hypothetical protein